MVGLCQPLQAQYIVRLLLDVYLLSVLICLRLYKVFLLFSRVLYVVAYSRLVTSCNTP